MVAKTQATVNNSPLELLGTGEPVLIEDKKAITAGGNFKDANQPSSMDHAPAP
jgi:hypothetical protein